MSGETIPDDVRKIANSIAWDLPSRVARANREFASNVIARAILAERERCARVAERDGSSHDATIGQQTAEWHARTNVEVRVADRIASAIRSSQPLKSVG